MSTESRAQKNSQTTWLCSLGTCRRIACERDCLGGGICCAGGQCLRIESRAQKCRMCCSSVQAGVHIPCVSTRFLSFLICSSRTGHPTEVFRSTRICSSRTCAQATSACLGTECLHVSRHQSSSWLVFFRAHLVARWHTFTYPLLPRVLFRRVPLLTSRVCQSFPRCHALPFINGLIAPRSLLDSSISLKSF